MTDLELTNQRAADAQRGRQVLDLLTPGDKIIADHFGAVRSLTFVRSTKSRGLFRWTAPSSGATRELWLTAELVGAKLRGAGERAEVVCGDGTLPAKED